MFIHHNGVVMSVWKEWGMLGGSAGHWRCICNAEPTIAVEIDNLGLKLSPSASKGKLEKKIRTLQPKITSQILYTKL